MPMICRGRVLIQRRLPADEFHPPCGTCHACVRAAGALEGDGPKNVTKAADAAKADAAAKAKAAAEVTASDAGQRPAVNDPKAAWVDHAVTLGWPRADAEAMTKAAIIDGLTEEDTQP
jgi:hypothetical protein